VSPFPLKLSPHARQDFIDILRYTGETWDQNQLLTYRDKLTSSPLRILAHRDHPFLSIVIITISSS